MDAAYHFIGAVALLGSAVSRLAQILLKRRRGAPMAPVARAVAVGGVGLEGDVNAAPASPRHVLLAGAAAIDALGVGLADLRANLIVDADVDALPSGTVLRIGDVRLRLTLPCEPCRKLEQVRAGLAAEVGGRRGMLARVIAGGVLVAGAPVVREADSLPALEPRWQARVADVLAHLPDGEHVTFARLAEVVGVHVSYVRALPAVLRRLPPGLPVERVLSSARAAAGRRLWDGASYHADRERAG